MAEEVLLTLLVTAPMPWSTAPVPFENCGVRLMVAPNSGLVVLGVRLVATGRATTVIVAFVLTAGLALLVAVSVHVCADAGAVHVVLTPLAVLPGLKEPQLELQLTDVSTAFVTVACAVVV